MNILITGACGHIGSYLADNIYKIKKVKKIYLVDDPIHDTERQERRYK